jgi:putative SOS response-associated peptidase YedK
MGEGFLRRRPDDQCAFGNREHQTRIPRCIKIPQVPDSCGRFLRVKRTGKTKQPYCFEVNDGELFAFAGIWDRWKDPAGDWIKTCSILTTAANTATAPVHDRMPVILDPDAYELWLDPGMTHVDAASDLLKPYDARQMRSFPVSCRINHVANDDATCSAPVELMQIQSRLFS